MRCREHSTVALVNIHYITLHAYVLHLLSIQRIIFTKPLSNDVMIQCYCGSVDDIVRLRCQLLMYCVPSVCCCHCCGCVHYVSDANNKV